MFSSIYLKTIYNLRWQIIGWSLGVGFVAFITMVFYNSFNQPNISSFLSTIPDSLKPLVGSVDDFTTIPGFIGQQIFGPNGYILALAAAIMIAVSVSASEEDDKRLQTLLTMPVTRSAVFCQKWLAVLSAMLVICATVVGAVYLGLLVVGHSADASHIFASAFALFLMTSAFATIAFGIAMFTGKKGLTITAASGYAALSFIVTSLAMSVDGLKDADKLSVLHYYNNPLIMQYGLNWTHITTLAAVILAIATISWLRFRHRNVGV